MPQLSKTSIPTVGGPDRIFRTDHLKDDLRRRSLRGGSITIVSQVVKALLGLGSTVILARLLTPADFGLVAKIYILVGIAEIAKDLGLSVASVQREKLTHRLASNLFWINLAVSFTVGLAFVASAPGVAAAYGDPRLVEVLAVFGGMYVLGGIAGQHQALLQRGMRFTAIAVLEVSARAVGVAAAILAAWRGFGYWALVLHLVVYAAVYAILIWPVTGWVPGLPSRKTGVRGMVRFGANLTLTNLLNHIVGNVNRMVIGMFAGDRAAGLFDRAQRLLLLPLHQVNTPMTAVALPALSRLQSSPERFRRAYLRAVSLIQTIAVPIVVFMFFWADQVIHLVLGPQWTDAADLFRIFAVAGLTRPLANTTGWLFIATGRTGEMLRWRLKTLWVTPVLCPLAFYVYGVPGVAWSIAAIALGMIGPAVWYAERGTGIGFWAIMRTAGQPLAAAVLAGLVLWPLVGRMHVLLAAPLMPIAHFAAACLLAGSFEPLRQIWDLRDALFQRGVA